MGPHTQRLGPGHSITSGKAECPHNFMHNKVVVADGTSATGSFNFSANATRNAENVLRIDNSDLADQYAAYVDGLVQRYG
jgi:phosphatidylserine/phosphatidylglycerophosphate/cardiolipin synthase-like enzyme